MRVLLDECVDRRLAGDIRGYDVKTVPEADWAAFSNIVLRAPSNRAAELRGLIPQLLAALPAAKRGAVTWIGGAE